MTLADEPMLTPSTAMITSGFALQPGQTDLMVVSRRALRVGHKAGPPGFGLFSAVMTR